ncbi:MAG: glutamate--tRNA ligase [Candidatus Woesearchaeota archaeon]
MDTELFIEKSALENAVKFAGKANPKALIGKVLGQFPDAKKDMKHIVSVIHSIVEKVNALSLESQKARLDELGGMSQKKAKEKGLKELDDAKPGNVVMRFAPSPSGPMHIGHAITGGLTSLYVKKYGGKFILRIEDTNAENIYPPAYDMLVDDAHWIFQNVSEVVVQSQRIDLYYSYAKDMLLKGILYVDLSSAEEFAECATKQIDPASKSYEPQKQLELFEQMIDGTIARGDAVVRYKGDMTHKNPAMRDFPLFRINETPHPKMGTKYRVWPLMNFSVFVDDLTMGMTHIIRAKDHADNAKRQELLYEALGKKPPITYFTGRYKFTDLELSSTKTREKIESGQYQSWDDIRLPTLCALKRRGFTPESILHIAEENGLSKTDKVVDKQEFFQTIEAQNSRILDENTKRYFLIREPHKIQLSRDEQVTLNAHPTKDLGSRTLHVKDSVYIEENDALKLQQGVVRLLDYCNITESGIVSQTYDEYKHETQKSGIIHWLPTQDESIVQVQIHMPDGSVSTALAEKTILSEEIGAIVQFERFGFCRLDSILDDGMRVFWFTQ